MFTLYRIGPAGYFSGTLEVEDILSIPFGYTEKPIPDDIPENHYPIFLNGNWELTNIPPIKEESFISVIDTRPEIIIENVSIDIDSPPNIIEDNFTVTCSTLATVTYTGKLLNNQNELVELTDFFRMPVISDDNRKYILLAKIDKGIVTVVAAIKSPGKWVVTEDIINQDLPIDKQMKFKGLTLYIYAS